MPLLRSGPNSATFGVGGFGTWVQANVPLIRAGVLIDNRAGWNFQPRIRRLADNLKRAGIEPVHLTKPILTQAFARQVGRDLG